MKNVTQAIIAGAVVVLYIVGISAGYNYYLPKLQMAEMVWANETYRQDMDKCENISSDPYTDEYYQYAAGARYDRVYGNPQNKCIHKAKRNHADGWFFGPMFRAGIAGLIWPVSGSWALGKNLV